MPNLPALIAAVAMVAIGTDNEQTEGSAGGPELTHSSASGFACSS